MRHTHSHTVAWRDRDGTPHSVTIAGCATHEEAREAALATALALGYTPPRWYQWWRWGEARGVTEGG